MSMLSFQSQVNENQSNLDLIEVLKRYQGQMPKHTRIQTGPIRLTEYLQFILGKAASKRSISSHSKELFQDAIQKWWPTYAETIKLEAIALGKDPIDYCVELLQEELDGNSRTNKEPEDDNS